MNVNKLVQKMLMLLIAIVSVQTYSMVQAVDGPAKELQNVASEIVIFDQLNNQEATMKNDRYQLVHNAAYALKTSFDFSAYNGNINNGDHFTFTIPQPYTLITGDYQLPDATTGVIVADAKVTAAGDNQGGTLTIKFKNLEQYLAQNGKTDVRDLKVNFFIDFLMKQTMSNRQTTFDGFTDGGSRTLGIDVAPRGVNDYSSTISIENLAKVHGVYTPSKWVSPTIGERKSDFWHKFTLRVNARGARYNNNIIINDDISQTGAPTQFIPEYFEVHEGSSFDTRTFILQQSKKLVAGRDYRVNFTDNYTKFELEIFNPGNKRFTVSYPLTAPSDGSWIGNTARMSSNNTAIPIRIVNPATTTFLERLSGANTGGSVSAETGKKITIYKVDEDTRQVLPGAVFKVTTPAGEEIVLEPTKQDGRIQTKTFTDAEIGTGEFKVEEVTAPYGYLRDLNVYTVNLTTSTEKGAFLTVKNKKIARRAAISVKKVWEDENNQDGKRQPVTIKLLANDQETGKELVLKEADGWTGAFDDLPSTTQDGTPVTYTISEVPVEGYDPIPTIAGDEATGFTVTNRREPSVVNIPVTKKWDDGDDQDGKRPETITVHLLADGAKVDQTLITEGIDGTWTFAFVDKPEFKNGQKIVYTLQEEEVPGYTAEIDQNTYTITNTYKPAKVTLSGEKVWNDHQNQDGLQPEEVTLDIKDGETVVDTVTVKKADNWMWTSTELPKYRAGQEIDYTVVEHAVPGYTSVVNKVAGRYVVTNTHTPVVQDITGRKTWVDEDNHYQYRPEKIIVRLFANDVEVAHQEVSAATNWEYTFSGVPQFEAGAAIVYTVKEDAVDKYDQAINGFDITNTLKPEHTTTTSTTTTTTTTTVENPTTSSTSSVDGSTTTTTEEPTTVTSSEETTTTTSVPTTTSSEPTTTSESSVTTSQAPRDVTTPQVVDPTTTSSETTGAPTEVPSGQTSSAANGTPGTQKVLPKTGDATNHMAVVLGVALLLILATVYLYLDKRQA